MSAVFNEALEISKKAMLPNVYKALNSARIFAFDDDSEPLIPDGDIVNCKTKVDYINEDFFLPFPCVSALFKDATKQSLIVIIEDTRPKQIGFEHPRKIYVLHKFWKEKHQPLEIIESSFKVVKDPSNKADYAIEIGDDAIAHLWENGEFETSYLSNPAPWKYYLDPEKNKDEKAKMNMRTKIAATLLIELQSWSIITSPDYFIMAKEPKKKRKLKPGQIRKVSERPEYTILKPYQIRERMGLPQPSLQGLAKRPHERRRHEAFLSHDKYRFDKQGMVIEPKVIPYGTRKGELYYKRIIKEAIWIGPSTNTTKTHVYRVLGINKRLGQ